VGLVSAREFTTRVQSKSFVISTAVIVAILIGGQVIFSIISGKDYSSDIAIVGKSAALSAAINQSAKSLHEDVKVRTSGSEAKARSQVKNGKLDIALIAESGGSFTAVSEKDLSDSLRAVLKASTRQVALDRGLDAQGVDASRLAADVAEATVSFDALKPSDPDKNQRSALAYVAVILLFFTVYLYGLYVAMGVVEEKTSRVVELLLATIRPIDLLVGKVIGIGAVGLVQVVVFGGVSLITGMITGLVTIGSTAFAVFTAAVVWYVLGFAFFAVLYAAMGSLVSRQEDVNSATMPLSILAFGTYFAAQASLQDTGATWVTLLSWLPPFSATLMPMRIAAGVTNPVEIVATVVIMMIVIAFSAIFAARVYENSVLNAGGRQSLKLALTSSR
jgi:ABC-2 type transport system permease protein